MPDEPVYDKYGARIPEARLNSLKYRMAAKLATAPRIDTATGRPLPVESQGPATRAANPHLVPDPAGLLEAAVHRAARNLRVPAAQLTDSDAYMSRVEKLNPDDDMAMIAAYHEASQDLTARASAAPSGGMRPNPAQGSSASPPAQQGSTMEQKARAMFEGNDDATKGGRIITLI